MSLTRIPADVVSAAQDGEFEDGESCVSCVRIFDECYRLPLCHDQVHVWCINCAVDRFTKAATGDLSLVPLQCDGPKHPLAIDALRHLLPKSTIDIYKARLDEKTTKYRVYCCKPDCATFLPSRHHTNTDWYTTAECHICHALTCSGCGKEWNDTHICEPDEIEERLPTYTAGLRIKQCPRCRRVIELSEACNHMSCHCGHDFCFVCLMPWDGGHDCPTYGDPVYDEQLDDWRGLHLRTGLDMDGYNRLGQHVDGTQREPQVLRAPEHDTHQDVENYDGEIEHDEDDFGEDDNNNWEHGDWLEDGEAMIDADDIPDDEVGWDAQANEVAEDLRHPAVELATGPNRAEVEDAAWNEQLQNFDGIAAEGGWDHGEGDYDIDDDRPSDDEGEEVETHFPRLPRQPRFPVCPGPPRIAVASLEQLECTHSFHYKHSSDRCFACQWHTHSYHYYCVRCQIVSCLRCRGSINADIQQTYGRAATNFCIDAMEEQVTTQDRLDKLARYYAKYPFERPDAVYNIDTMFIPFEERYQRCNAFVDAGADFGIEVMLAADGLNYAAQRLFHSAFKIARAGGDGFTLQELPLGNPTWFSFLAMNDVEVEYWRDEFLEGLPSNCQTIVDPVKRCCATL